MRCQIAYPRGRQTVHQYSQGPFYDYVRWAYAHSHIGDTGLGNASRENSYRAGRKNRPSDMRHRRNARSNHWTNVHIADSCCRHSHGFRVFHPP
jgi:hypothetical protein